MDGLNKDNYFFYFETNKFEIENYRSYYFYDPVKVLRLENPELIIDFFDELNDLTKKYYVAGFFSYELGYFLEEAFRACLKTKFPLAFFCAYERPAIFDHNLGRFISGRVEIPPENEDYTICNLKLNTSDEDYKKNIQRIRDYIRKGDIYQANYTIKYNFDFSGSPIGLFTDLKNKQYVPYNVFAGFDDFHILSLSPELFFRKKGNKITVKPMKGTYRRGRNITEDEKNRQFLAHDGKNQSENVMIVDLLRNDLGKVSKSGSVKVTKLYEVEKYNTLFQMTSTIESTLENDVTVYDLIKSIFPSGSVTGAPKIRSMEIIKNLEKEERKVYTGSIGFFEPTGDSVFNVAIRTILLKGNKGEMGIGGGIVYDSVPDDEFQECKLKAVFLLQKAVKEFSIIETILYNEGYEHLDLHIKRMRGSADYFDYLFNKDSLMQSLNDMRRYMLHGRYKVRVLLDRFGHYTITHTRLEDKDNESEFKITISKKHTDSNDIFLFHKTTARDLYEKEFADARKNGFFDVIFLNENDEITEGAITNVYFKMKDKLLTPPLECGLLNGIIRQTLLGKDIVKEKRITLKDIYKAEAFYISNSIIGFREAKL